MSGRSWLERIGAQIHHGCRSFLPTKLQHILSRRYRVNTESCRYFRLTQDS